MDWQLITVKGVGHEDRGHQEIVKFFAEIACDVQGFVESEAGQKIGESWGKDKGRDSDAKSDE